LFNWEEKITLTLDRTNWKFGKIDINFLVISGIYNNHSIPLCWMLLPHRGNSHTNQRIDLIERLLFIVPLSRIKTLLADREFIGEDWFLYLKEKGISFCIRVRENILVHDVRRGGTIQLKKLLKYLAIGQTRELYQKISEIPLRIFGTRILGGELLILAVFGDDDLFDAFNLYARRWTIETMFKSFKSAGFNFEATHQQNLERLYKIMILLAISYTWAIKIGEIKNEIQPIKIKTTQKSEFSIFSYGFRAIQTILLKGVSLQKKLICLLTKITLNTPFSDDLAKVTVVY
jgi:hypothetical protein